MSKIKGFILITILSTMLLFSGCGSMEVGTKTTIDEKGAGVITLKMSAQGIYEQVINSEENNKFLKEKDKNIQHKKYKEGNNSIDEYTRKFNNPEDFNKMFKDSKDTDFRMNLKENKGFFKTTYEYKIDFPKNFDLDNISKEALKNKNTQGEDMEIVSDQEIKAFIGSSITLYSELTVPGKVVTTNATSSSNVKSKNILKWRYSLAQINPKNPLIAKYEIINKVNVGITAGGAIALIVIIVLIIMKKKK